MISKIAWNTFKKTGNVNTFLEFIETKNIEKELLEEQGSGNNKNESNYFKRK